MKPYTRLTSRMIPLPIENIDTDQIIPASYLKGTTKEGLAEGLFAGWRYGPDGSMQEAFPLNHTQNQEALVLVTGANFGCGSSREHAPWALMEWGLKAIISTSFADIFRNNALKNGLLPIVVDEETHRQILSLIMEDSASEVTIDLATQSVTLPDGRQARFEIDRFSKTCLLQGVDQLGYLLKQASKISDYEKRTAKDRSLTIDG